MATPNTMTVGQEPAAIDTSISTEKHSAKNAPESSAKVMNIVLRVLEGIGLIFANIITFGLINCIPAIHDEYQKVFGSKQVVVMDDAEMNATPNITDSVDVEELSGEDASANPTNINTTEEEVSASQKLWTLWETGKDRAAQACTKENAQFAFDKTREGVSYGLSQINRENAQKIYDAATSPRNINKTIGAVGAIAFGVMGLGIYAYSGDSAGDIATAAFNATSV